MVMGRTGRQSANDAQNVERRTELLRDRLGSALRLVDELAGAPPPARGELSVSEASIRSVIRLRRNRDHCFGADLFADPAWDILLELYASLLGQQRVSVTSLCNCAAVPATTALRWISALQERQLIVRHPDPLDGRRHFITLSDTGLKAMENYLRTVPFGTPMI